MAENEKTGPELGQQPKPAELKEVPVERVMSARKGGSFDVERASLNNVSIANDRINNRQRVTVGGKTIYAGDGREKNDEMSVDGVTVHNAELKEEIRKAVKDATKDGKFTVEEAKGIGDIAKKVIAAAQPQPGGRGGPK